MASNPQVSHDIKLLQFNDLGNTMNSSSTTINVLIELDEDTDERNGDEDCVFLSEIIPLSRGNHKQSPICVDGYFKQERELQLLTTTKPEEKEIISVQCVDDYDVDDNDEIRVLTERPFLSSTSTKRRKPFTYSSITEVGESSGSKSTNNIEIEVIEIAPDPPEVIMFICEICADSKPQKDSFKIKGCSHSYCFDCMKNYVASKLQDGVSHINCPVPSCPGLLEPEYCRDILPFEVFDRWGKLLCESVILASQKFYCPFKDCSALLIDDDDGVELITQSECPSCFRLFCAQCKVGWHEGIECAEYQKLNKDERDKEDIMLRNLAKGKPDRKSVV